MRDGRTILKSGAALNRFRGERYRAGDVGAICLTNFDRVSSKGLPDAVETCKAVDRSTV
jgi:hypothetical protein